MTIDTHVVVSLANDWIAILVNIYIMQANNEKRKLWHGNGVGDEYVPITSTGRAGLAERQAERRAERRAE